MSDDLKERLSDMSVLSQSRTPADALRHIEELEARLAKAEVIVRIIASDKWDERLGEAVDLSCEYLAELMGDEDDE